MRQFTDASLLAGIAGRDRFAVGHQWRVIAIIMLSFHLPGMLMVVVLDVHQRAASSWPRYVAIDVQGIGSHVVRDIAGVKLPWILVPVDFYHTSRWIDHIQVLVAYE